MKGFNAIDDWYAHKHEWNGGNYAMPFSLRALIVSAFVLFIGIICTVLAVYTLFFERTVSLFQDYSKALITLVFIGALINGALDTYGAHHEAKKKAEKKEKKKAEKESKSSWF